MPDQTFDAEPYVDAAAAPIGLPIDPAHRPGIVAPLRKPGELPIGVQIIAAPWREADALRAAWALECYGITCATPSEAQA